MKKLDAIREKIDKLREEAEEFAAASKPVKKKVTFMDEQEEKNASALEFQQNNTMSALAMNDDQENLWTKVRVVLEKYVKALETHEMGDHVEILREMRQFYERQL